MDVAGCPEGPWFGEVLVDGANDAKGSLETLGAALTDAALEVAACSEDTKDGGVDALKWKWR